MTDREWELVAPFVPPAKRGGRRRTTDMREVINAILYNAASGSACSEMNAYGFHRPFEAAANLPPVRTHWLERDLIDLGADATSLATLPCTRAFSAQLSHAYVLGARYAVEGSALGGRGLAR